MNCFYLKQLKICIERSFSVNWWVRLDDLIKLKTNGTQNSLTQFAYLKTQFLLQFLYLFKQYLL